MRSYSTYMGRVGVVGFDTHGHPGQPRRPTRHLLDILSFSLCNCLAGGGVHCTVTWLGGTHSASNCGCHEIQSELSDFIEFSLGSQSPVLTKNILTRKDFSLIFFIKFCQRSIAFKKCGTLVITGLEENNASKMVSCEFWASNAGFA